MTQTYIKDGTGTGRLAKVDVNNRLFTNSVSLTEQSWQSEEGRGFNINTGLISLTSAAESGLLYLKYTGTTYFNIAALAVGVGLMGGTVTDPTYIKIYRNPTGGTLISNAVTSGIQNGNRNFGATSTLNGTIYKGAEGATVTGGDVIASFYQGGSGRLFAGIDFILEPQTSIAISLEPNASTAGDVYCALIGYEGEA